MENETMNERKAVISAINAYGYKFDIPVTMNMNQYLTNKHNANYFIIASVKQTVKNDQLNYKERRVTFKTSTNEKENEHPLSDKSFYWLKVTFEDGTVIENNNTPRLLEAASLEKMSYEFNHRAKFNDELNKNVGQPVLCESTKSDNFKVCGLLLSVNPVKDGRQIATVSVSGDVVYFMNFCDTNLMKVYKDNGEKLELDNRVSVKDQEHIFGNPSQPGNE